MFVICSHCQNESYAPNELADQKVKCPKCKKSFVAEAKAGKSGYRQPFSSGRCGLCGGPWPEKRRSLNHTKGFRRFGLVLSILGGVLFVVLARRLGYTLADYLDGPLGADYGWLDRLSVHFVSGVAGFGVVWFIYGVVWFVVRGFLDNKPAKKRKTGKSD